MDWKLFFSTFTLIFVAELPDKTALATLMMATRGRPVPIFVGVAAAFVVQTAVAVAFGSLVGKLPEKWVHLAAGLLFFVFAGIAWTRKEENEEAEDSAIIERNQGGAATGLRAAWSSFLVIFIAEWGDLTQLASASLAARFRSPITIFLASLLALWSVSALAIFIGHRLKRILRPELLQKLAALIFAGVGIYFVLSYSRAA